VWYLPRGKVVSKPGEKELNVRKLPLVVLGCLGWLVPAIPVAAQAPMPPTAPVATPAPVTEAAAILAEARRIEEHTENQVSLIVTLMEIFMGAVALVTIILTGIGLREWRHVSAKAEATLDSVDVKVDKALKEIGDKVDESVRKAEQAVREANLAVAQAQSLSSRGQELIAALEKDTEEAKRKAEEATRLAESASRTAGESSQQIEAMKDSLVEAWSGEIGKAFADLPDLEAEWEFVFKAESLGPEIPIQFEDLDALFVICDRLKIPADAEIMVDGFLQLGRYWRVVVQDFPRALVRVERALALASTEALERRCLLHRARVSIQWVTYKPDEHRSTRLEGARSDLKRVRQIQGRDDSSTLFERAWLADIEERFDAAADLWVRGREEGLQEGKSLHADLWLFGYNLACTLSRGGRLQDALDELRSLVGNGSEWIRLASKDSDLEKLRKDPEWGRAFEELLEEGRRTVD